MWYYTLGLNYETFGHVDLALQAYREGFQHPRTTPGLHFNLSMGVVRGLLATGCADQIPGFMEEVTATAPNEQERRRIQQALPRIQQALRMARGPGH